MAHPDFISFRCQRFESSNTFTFIQLHMVSGSGGHITLLVVPCIRSENPASLEKAGNSTGWLAGGKADSID